MALTTLISISPLYAAALGLVGFLVCLVVNSKKYKLDHIPGPFIAKYTDAWRAYKAWSFNHFTDGNNYQTELLGKYGDVVRIGPNTVLVLDPEAINTVLGFKERLEKGPGYQVFVIRGTTQTALVGIKDEATHGRYRRPIANAYSLSSLKGYEPYIDQTINTLTDVLDQRVTDGKAINMSDYLHYWSFDVISTLTFGEPLGFIQHGNDFNGMIKAQKAVFRHISITNNMPLLDTIVKMNPIPKLLQKKPNVFFNFASRVVKERVSQADVEKATQKTTNEKGQQIHKDLLSNFIAARPSYPDVMTDLRITHYATTNVLAGANNSALAMDRTIHYLAHHPDMQEKLHGEIMNTKMDDIKDTEGPPALDLALKMKFLEAIIQESYRTFAMPSNNLERLVSPAGLTLPNGVRLPPGAVAAMNGPALMHRKEIFGEDVDVFRPQRWMKGENETEEQFAQRRLKMDRSMLPFGSGSRTCIGRNVVQLELYKIWPHLVKTYKFEPVGDVKLHNVWVTVKRR
ncbi:cytochrome P450 [Rhizodiscina lignyota]|uniref:Cytochrome P450 n=1 Tax=Rhizodiscina lignyota TaxID=1504668 RepID=A0A9P4IPV0_9PEZI|nr:cytochrome P450 [Rhizodiscina lignyota]